MSLPASPVYGSLMGSSSTSMPSVAPLPFGISTLACIPGADRKARSLVAGVKSAGPVGRSSTAIGVVDRLKMAATASPSTDELSMACGLSTQFDSLGSCSPGSGAMRVLIR